MGTSWNFALAVLSIMIILLSGQMETSLVKQKIRHHRNQGGRNGGLQDRYPPQHSTEPAVIDQQDVFISDNNTVIVAHKGSTTTLLCQVHKDSQYGVITWAKLEDRSHPYTVLTIGDTKYMNDDRISIEKPIRHDNWNLRIQKVDLLDGGMYECQATTHPPKSIFVQLRVVAAYSEIVGTKDKVFNSGSRLQLICVLKLATSKPDYIFWYHNERMINFDHDRGISVQEDENGSTLTMINVSVSDSGNYSCQPQDMKPDSVQVTILSEKQAPLARQDKTLHTTASAREGYCGISLLYLTTFIALVICLFLS